MENWRLVHIKKRYEIGGLTTREAVGFLVSISEKDREQWLAWRPGAAGWVKVTECSELRIAPSDTAWWFGEEQLNQAPPPVPMAPLAPAAPVAPAAFNAFQDFTKELIKEVVQEKIQEKVIQPFPVSSVPSAPQAHSSGTPAEAPQEVVATPLPSNIRQMPQREETRRMPRVNLRLKVVVTDGKKSFRAYSVNVSLGGLLLEKKVPWSMSGKTCQVYLSNENSSESISFVARILSNGSDPFRLAFEECDPKYLIILQSWMNTHGDGPKAAAS